MLLKDFFKKEDNKLSAEINCDHCINNASIRNKECVQCLSKRLSKQSKTVILNKRGFKKVYKGKDLKSIINNKPLPKVTPSFIKSRLLSFNDSFKIIDKYQLGDSLVTIKEKDSTIIYCLDPVETHLSANEIIKINDFIKKMKNKELVSSNLKLAINNSLNKQPISSKLKEIIKRHTIGFGLIDLLFNDEQIQDLFIDSPGNKTVHIIHGKYNECLTNLMISKKELSSIATKVRAVSGRPFDESFPVLHYDLNDYEIRVCGICEPLTFKGIGYAFRKHKKVPWTVPQLISNEMLSDEAAGLINFLVDGQASILITGPRGSGKTSLLSALISEVPKSNRMVLIEDTPEIPVNNLEQAGFKIQHIRINPSELEGNYELRADEALRTSLRLGDSVLIIGEVRGPEAKVLFEAMRVGATGKTVLGTIHGSSAYDTYDRIVNDLGVPKSSFKAADIVISCAGLRQGESLSRVRRVTSITEVTKNWQNDPSSEKGFLELTNFDRKSMKLSLNKELIDKSSIIKRISEIKGMSLSESIKSIKLRGKAKSLVSSKKVPKDPLFTALCNDKLREFLSKDPDSAIKKFRLWLSSEVKGYKTNSQIKQ